MIITIKKWFASTGHYVEDPLQEYKCSGDYKYIELVIDRYASDLYHFLLTQCNASIAEDICQKTWLILIEKKHAYRANGKLKAYVFRIARNLLLDELKALKRLDSMDGDLLSGSVHANEDNEISTKEKLYKAIQRLPLKQKEALSLQLEGFSLEEISDITQTPFETVKTRLRYARSALKSMIGADSYVS